jgi:AcrR family transcriptional regulator
MNKISDKKKQKQFVILCAAQNEFLDFGFDSANMDNIAEQANVTKQTVYRYFSSKKELFKATLTHIGEKTHQGYFKYLDNEDSNEALELFAIGFIKAHLSDEHIATYRLLLSECIKEPEIIDYFFEQGAHDTSDKLTRFFEDKLNIANSEQTIALWTAMLISLRDDVLLGKKKPSLEKISLHAKEATRWLQASIGC